MGAARSVWAAGAVGRPGGGVQARGPGSGSLWGPNQGQVQESVGSAAGDLDLEIAAYQQGSVQNPIGSPLVLWLLAPAMKREAGVLGQ